MARRRHGRANRRSCCRKKHERGNVYELRVNAEEAARRISAQHGVAVDAYRCPQCDQWHVGKRIVFHRGTG